MSGTCVPSLYSLPFSPMEIVLFVFTYDGAAVVVPTHGGTATDFAVTVAIGITTQLRPYS